MIDVITSPSVFELALLWSSSLKVILPTMPSISLTTEQTAQRFGVRKAISNFPSNLTAQEEANVKVVLEYMEVRKCRLSIA